MMVRTLFGQFGVLCVASGLAMTAAAQAPNPETSENWQKIRKVMFDGQPINADAAAVITFETPVRAEDAAVVPIAIRAVNPQTPERYIEKVWLIVDKNPSPLGATFKFTPESGRADIETRIRVEEYSHIRAIAQMNDGKLFMATNYIKASGGCSAPAGADMAKAKANMGKTKFMVDGEFAVGKPTAARLMVSHPNESGLAMDQVSRTYAPPHFVRTVEVTYAGKVVMSADIDFTISENPNFRFYFTPKEQGELVAHIVDNTDLTFKSGFAVSPTRLAAN
jgi:sulfur-oxidizing protein SoxY